MSIDLTDKEQAVLDAACIRVEKATQEAQTLQRAAEQAARKADAMAHEARGVFRSIMELGGKNPDAHQLNWDGEKATITEKPEAPKSEPEPADNVVPMPSPKEDTAGDGNA